MTLSISFVATPFCGVKSKWSAFIEESVVVSGAKREFIDYAASIVGPEKSDDENGLIRLSKSP